MRACKRAVGYISLTALESRRRYDRSYSVLARIQHVMTPVRLRIMAAGECSALLPVLEWLTRSSGSSFRVLPFSSPEDVASHLEDWTLDLLFVDADCTRVCAATVCRALKEHPATRLLPVLVVSCSARACSEALAAGADDFVTPQIPPHVLLTRLEALTQLSLMRRRAVLTPIEARGSRSEPTRLATHPFRLPRPADRVSGEWSPFETPADPARAVVLVADLRGFNRICESTNPQRLETLLDEYYCLLADVTRQHEGTVFQTAGRSMLVGFGVRPEHSDGVGRACDAAQQMLTRFEELASLWRKRFRLQAALSIGLNEGSVAAVTVALAQSLYVTLVGDAVNVASRLCHRARAGEMVVSAALKNSLDARGLLFPATQLPPLYMRGRSQPVSIFCAGLPRRLNLYGQAMDDEMRRVSVRVHG
jgi:adenylate cyclase